MKSVSLNELQDMIKERGIQIWGTRTNYKSILDERFTFKNENFLEDLLKQKGATDAYFDFVNGKGIVKLHGKVMEGSEFEKAK